MPKPSFLVTVVLLLLGLGWLIVKLPEWQGVLFFTAFCLGPLLMQLFPTFLCRTRPAQGILFVASLAYAAWLVFVWYEAFILHPDAQSPIALVFAGIYGLPVMLLFWIAAVTAEWVSRKKAFPPPATDAQGVTDDPDRQIPNAGSLTNESGNPYQPPAGPR